MVFIKVLDFLGFHHMIYISIYGERMKKHQESTADRLPLLIRPLHLLAL
jgi:hypothetical protein